jgi:hypothetical protein
MKLWISDQITKYDAIRDNLMDICKDRNKMQSAKIFDVVIHRIQMKARDE